MSLDNSYIFHKGETTSRKNNHGWVFKPLHEDTFFLQPGWVERTDILTSHSYCYQEVMHTDINVNSTRGFPKNRPEQKDISGTEKVWLTNYLLIRFLDNDYLITNYTDYLVYQSRVTDLWTLLTYSSFQRMVIVYHSQIQHLSLV